MNTSFGECLRGVLANAFMRWIIARRAFRLCAILGLAAALGACAATRLAYNQAHTLGYWWIDRHLGLSEAQTGQTREDLHAFFQWHRREELPVYAGLLRQWQTLAEGDISAAQVCAQFDDIQQRLDRAAAQTVEPFAQLARQITPSQLHTLQRQQVKSNGEFDKEFLRGSAEQRLNRRLDKALERSESFYGRLDDTQREKLRDLLDRSPFDPQLAQAERLRRQADLLQTLRDVQLKPAQAERLVGEHIARIRRSPSPAHEAYAQSLVQAGCAQLAALHNSTTAEQRAKAVRKLKDYEDDLRVLSAQR